MAAVMELEVEPELGGGREGQPATDGAAEAPPSGKMSLSEKLAQRKEALKRGHDKRRAEEDAKKERWSGLPIAERCVRAEKWDVAMQGKELVPISGLADLSSTGRDQQVVIAVLCKPAALALRAHADGPRFAEWFLTDLRPGGSAQGHLQLFDGAMEHWACSEGDGWSRATLGSVLAVLNPRACRKPYTMKVNVASQILKLGVCPALAFCKSRIDGMQCCIPFDNRITGQSDYCPRHAVSHGVRKSHTAVQESAKRQGGMSGPSFGAWSGGRSCVVARPAGSDRTSVGKPMSAVAAELVERATRAFADAAVAPSSLRALLVELETADLEADTIRGSQLYERVGQLVPLPDGVGAAAKRLRRAWRLVLDGAAAGAAPDAKRFRASRLGA